MVSHKHPCKNASLAQKACNVQYHKPKQNMAISFYTLLAML